MIKNHYQTLGIKRNANPDEIKSAYRKLAMKYHPDKNNGAKFYEELFKEIQNAYENLSDENKRKTYDYQYEQFFGNVSDEVVPTDNSNLGNFTQQNNFYNSKSDEFDYESYMKNYKKNADLPFEDKAWIFLGNWVFPGLVGLIMFFNYRNKGFNRKSNQVCSLTLVSFLVLFFLGFLIALIGAANK